MLPEPIAATIQVTTVLEKLGIPYLVGGSLASTIHGLVRTTQDSDLVAELRAAHGQPVAAGLERRVVGVDAPGNAAHRHGAGGRASAQLIVYDVFTQQALAVLDPDIARQGQGSLEKLINAYKRNFEIWQEGNLVHIRYGEVSSGCYCPAARFRPAKPDDLHCECTRTTHQTIFETALGRPLQVDVVETVRRGGKTCHFIVHLD